MLELTAVKCKRKIARVSLQEVFGECITMSIKSDVPFFSCFECCFLVLESFS